jgi:30S ribosomal protein S31
MGKGDRRSRRGKIWSGSFGNSRPKKKNTTAGGSTEVTEKPEKVKKPAAKKAAVKKPAAKKPADKKADKE